MRSREALGRSVWEAKYTLRTTKSYLSYKLTTSNFSVKIDAQVVASDTQILRLNSVQNIFHQRTFRWTTTSSSLAIICSWHYWRKPHIFTFKITSIDGNRDVCILVCFCLFITDLQNEGLTIRLLQSVREVHNANWTLNRYTKSLDVNIQLKTCACAFSCYQ